MHDSALRIPHASRITYHALRHMGIVDFILNLAGLLLWLNWRSNRFDPLVKRLPATLMGTLRPAAPKRLRSCVIIASLACRVTGMLSRRNSQWIALKRPRQGSRWHYVATDPSGLRGRTRNEPTASYSRLLDWEQARGRVYNPSPDTPPPSGSPRADSRARR